MSNFDWRTELFGDYILMNNKKIGGGEDGGRGDCLHDEESAPNKKEEDDPTHHHLLVDTAKALDEETYDYIAVFIGADYCPHCKAFAPTVGASAPILEHAKRCQTVFVSNDRTPEAFKASCSKNSSLDLVMPYNLDKTRAMRELFDLQTIPALMILRNSHFDNKTPAVVTNARHLLVEDPQANHFPWKKEESEQDPHQHFSKNSTHQGMSLMDRLVIRGKYGKWWELGHHVNPEKPGQMYMDEHAVRIRAGLLNVISWLAIINIFYWKNPDFVKIIFPIVAVEFITSANIGLTPIAPIGTMSTIIAWILQPEPHWKPAGPKRFAWCIGLGLASSCLLIFLLRDAIDNDDLYRPLIGAVAMMCNLATWLEAACGFCLGCFIYNTYMVPMFKLDECSECKL